MEILLISFVSYICGSVPFGLILVKIFTKNDIRNIGSGNIGATNVLRTGNKYLAVCTLLLDCLKGYFPVAVVNYFFPDQLQISALMVFLGHVFPIWLKFKGGKGVATYLGVLFALSIELAVLFIFTWIAVSLIFKYSSLSSMFATLTVLMVTIFRDNVINSINPNLLQTDNLKILLFIFFILIIFTHRKNISNLKNSTEKKIKI